jgi:hypothetical protein
VHDKDPFDEIIPAGQRMHRSASEYVPAAHVEQVALPLIEKEPAGQDMHTVDPASEYDPARQSAHNFIVDSENVPAAHNSQLSAPVAASQEDP